MATKYALAAYILQVHPRGEPKKFLPTDNFDGNGNDLLVVLNGFLSWMTGNPQSNDQDQKVYEVMSVDQDNRRLKVTTESGEWGVESRLRNVLSGAQVATRSKDDAELLTLRTWIVVPSSRQAGLMLTERVGQRGQASMFKAFLAKAFNARFPDFILLVEPQAPAGAFKKAFDDGELKTIRLTRNSIPDDVAAHFDLSDETKEIGKMTTIIQAPRGIGFSKKTVQEVLNKIDKTDLLTVGGEVYDEIRVDVRVGSTNRSLNVTTQQPPNVTFHLTDGIRPDDDVIWTEALAVATDLAGNVGLTQTLDQPFDWTKNGRLTYRLPLPSPPAP